MKREKSKTGNRLLGLAAVLFLLVMLSGWHVSGLLARYAEVVSNGGEARVASFSVQADADGQPGVVDCTGGSAGGAYVLHLENNSEVAVGYQVRLSFKDPLPEGVAVMLDGKEPQISTDRKTLTFADAGRLSVAETKERSIAFWAEPKIFTKESQDEEYSLSLAFETNVDFEQID